MAAKMEKAENEKPTAPIEVQSKRIFADERMISDADPCQARAVRLAQRSDALVVHGPPGTGKSQTITNVISDHLARGQRVLFVSDKRTALDVVADRLNVQGLGGYCATVHDPKHDQRELYRSVVEQLDGLVDAPLKPGSKDILGRIDTELQTLHDDLLNYHRILIGQNGGPGSFHHLIGIWLTEMGNTSLMVDDRPLQSLVAGELEKHSTRLKETLERAEMAGYRTNPWKDAGGVALSDFLATSMESYRAAMNQCVADAHEADAAHNPVAPGYAPDADLITEAESRKKLSTQLKQVLSRLKPQNGSSAFSDRRDGTLLDAREKINAARQWIEIVRRSRLDSSILASAGTKANPAQLQRELEIVGNYLRMFRAIESDLARVRRTAREADEATILHWIAQGRTAAASAYKKLSAATGLARAVETSALDAALMARLVQHPLNSRQLSDFLAALNGYLETSGKWFGLGGREKTKESEEAARHFGLSLNAKTAAELKDFLSKVMQRMDLAAIVQSITGVALASPPDDEQILCEFKKHFAVVQAVAQESSPADSNNEPTTSSEVVRRINELIRQTSDPAGHILANYQLQTNAADAARLENFLRGLEARIRLTHLHEELTGATASNLVPDEVILKTVETEESLFELLDAVKTAGASASVADAILRSLGDVEASAAMTKALSESPRRAAALIQLEKSLRTVGLFDETWLKNLIAEVRAGALATEIVAKLAESLGTLEGVLRVKDNVARLPGPLADAALKLIANNANAGEGYSAIRRAVVAGEIARRLRQDPELQSVDGVRFRTTFDRYRELIEKKQHLVKDVICDLWTERQRNRLLASGHNRLNGLGADLRRRMTGRGDRAMRLRQVIAHGASVEGGDPLFELRPVWMASPETVSQLFPRQPIFDVVVFDEASQCRLEDALPVLTRAKRVVIAGDPQQLPPTRFFESAVASSEEADIETEQELFEAHQAQVEDLLGAALGLDIQQCYLDVHYRSRNSDLIGFSNQHFYQSRLQPIPDHPRNRTMHPPLTLYRVDGVYEKRTNDVEAATVVQIVRNLLARPEPPSIGIACFNLQQRELIIEKIEECAEQDPDFASKLLAARARRGAGASDGLFVKNLESIQGDERDHLIISTTFGPDPNGKFRRNFGPVGAPGGGRRLNVLVTRARQEIHVVTSIPRSAYATLPPVPDGQQPTGVWLLFAYLNFIEQMTNDYEVANRIIQNTSVNDRAMVDYRRSKVPSNFAKALGQRLASMKNVGSTIHWGNDGFCVDLAIAHPGRAEDVVLGVLCDTTRYSTQQDAVEWEVFRTQILEQQGWKLHRLWTPHFFRDPSGCTQQIIREMQTILDGESQTMPAASTNQQSVTGPSIRDAIAIASRPMVLPQEQEVQQDQPMLEKDAA